MIQRVSLTWCHSCLLSEAVVRTTLMLTSKEYIMMFRMTTKGELCEVSEVFSLTTQNNDSQYKYY